MQDEVKVTQAARDAFANWEPMFSVWPVRDSKHSVAIAKAAFLAGFEAHRHQAERETLARMEPVAWMYYAEDGQEATAPLKNRLVPNTMGWTETPLYATPPQDTRLREVALEMAVALRYVFECGEDEHMGQEALKVLTKFEELCHERLDAALGERP